MCLRAIETKHYSCSAEYLHLKTNPLYQNTVMLTANYSNMLMLLLTVRETYTLNSSQNLRRKGGKFDHRPERPKVLLRHAQPGNIFPPRDAISSAASVRSCGVIAVDAEVCGSCNF